MKKTDKTHKGKKIKKLPYQGISDSIYDWDFFRSGNVLNKVKEKEAIIKSLIPQLKNIQKITETPYEINVYEGKEGLRSFFRLVLKH